MTTLAAAGLFELGDRRVKRMGYGAMQLAGPGVFGPPKDHHAAVAVLREAVAMGVDHIDTSDFYGPHVTNQLIREALHPYPDQLVIVTKVGAVRGADGSWNPAYTPAELTNAVHDNLRNLGLDALHVVNLRVGTARGAGDESIEEQLTTLVELQRQGLIRHLGLSNATPAQIAEGRGHLWIGTGSDRWVFQGEENDFYQTEHDELFKSIRTGKPINNGEYMVRSTLLAIMGRMAAYTGQEITWDKAWNSKEDLSPPRYDWMVALPDPPIAIPGKTKFV